MKGAVSALGGAEIITISIIGKFYESGALIIYMEPFVPALFGSHFRECGTMFSVIDSSLGLDSSEDREG